MSVLIPTMIGKHHLKLDMPGEFSNKVLQKCLTTTISHIEQHSKKPDEVRDKIVKLMGDQPRVELFARQKTPGWDVWGNEVNCTLTMPERKG